MTILSKLNLDLPEGADLWNRAQFVQAIVDTATAVGYTLCTSTTRPSSPYVGMQIYETDTRRRWLNINGTAAGWRPIAGDTFDSIGAGTVRAIRPVRPYGWDTNHSAFPSVCVLANGTALLAYRHGTNHSAARDGVIRIATSTDMGRTWSAPTTIFSGPIGTDLRDPCVSLSRDGTAIYLTFFKGTAVFAAAGVFFTKSTDGGATWSPEVRIDSLPYAASSAPVVELNNGTLVMPFYGRAGAEVWDSVWTSKSTDGGATWAAQVRIINGTTATDHRQEPYIALLGTTAIMGYRHGTAASIGISTSVDNTVNWSAGAAKFAGSGRPNVFFTNDNTLSCIYRSTVNEDAVIRSSKDNGTSWTPERLVDFAPTAAGWSTYSGTDRLTRGVNLCVLAQESSDTVSRLFITCVGEAGANTPLGVIPPDSVAHASNLDTVIFGTMFEQPDGALEQPWTLAAGSVTVTNGAVKSTTIDGVPDFPRVFVGVNDMEVEADILNIGGFESGAGVIFRMINATAYLMFTIETNGVNYRLYKVVGGVATQLGSTVAGQMAFAAYNTYKIVARGQEIRTFFNGAHIHVHLLSGPDYTTFQTGHYAGIKLNSQGVTTHSCRRFLVRG